MTLAENTGFLGNLPTSEAGPVVALVPRAVRPNRLGNNRGFTLVEAMGVVALVGVLSALAVWGVRKYILSAKSAEAIYMIGAIKTAQEQYRAETFNYLDVSGSHSLGSMATFYPTSTPSNKAWGWGDTSTDQGKAFRTLGVVAQAPVYYTYGCAAGDASNAVPDAGTSQAVPNWGLNSGQQWYVVRAVGDLDNDGKTSVLASASFTDRIIIDNEGE
jgi:type IV pilus assembly protein PilA